MTAGRLLIRQPSYSTLQFIQKSDIDLYDWVMLLQTLRPWFLVVAASLVATLSSALSATARADEPVPNYVFYAGGPVCSSPFAAQTANDMFVLHRDFNHFPASCVSVEAGTKVVELDRAGEWARIAVGGEVRWTTSRFLKIIPDAYETPKTASELPAPLAPPQIIQQVNPSLTEAKPLASQSVPKSGTKKPVTDPAGSSVSVRAAMGGLKSAPSDRHASWPKVGTFSVDPNDVDAPWMLCMWGTAVYVHKQNLPESFAMKVSYKVCEELARKDMNDGPDDLVNQQVGQLYGSKQ